MWWVNGIFGGALMGLLGGFAFGYGVVLLLATGEASTEAVMAMSAASGGAFVGLIQEHRIKNMKEGGSDD